MLPGMSTDNIYIDPIIAAALAHADKVLGSGPWTGTTEKQEALIERLPELRALLALLPEGYVDALGATTAAPVNKFLADNGFDLELDDRGPGLYVAAILNMMLTWAVTGTQNPVYINNVAYPGALLPSESFMVAGNVAHIPTTSKVVCRLVQSDNLADGLELLTAEEASNPVCGRYSKLQFPCADLNVEANLDTLMGMSKGDFYICQALAQMIVKLDEMGAEAKVAVAFSMERSFCADPWFSIDGPYTVGFFVDNKCVIAAHVGLESMKRPQRDTPKEPVEDA